MTKKGNPTGDYDSDSLNLAAHITGDPTSLSAGSTVQATGLGAWGTVVIPLLIILAMAWLFRGVRV